MWTGCAKWDAVGIWWSCRGSADTISAPLPVCSSCQAQGKVSEHLWGWLVGLHLENSTWGAVANLLLDIDWNYSYDQRTQNHLETWETQDVLDNVGEALECGGQFPEEFHKKVEMVYYRIINPGKWTQGGYAQEQEAFSPLGLTLEQQEKLLDPIVTWTVSDKHSQLTYKELLGL